MISELVLKLQDPVLIKPMFLLAAGLMAYLAIKAGKTGVFKGGAGILLMLAMALVGVYALVLFGMLTPATFK